MEADASAAKTRNRKPYKRKLTDKRRLQNRAAQRTYRLKCKERLEYLESAVAGSQVEHQNDVQEAIDSTESRSGQGEECFLHAESLGIEEDVQLIDACAGAPAIDRLLVDSAWDPSSPTFLESLSEMRHSWNSRDTIINPLVVPYSRFEDMPVGALRQLLGLEDELDVDSLFEFANAKQPTLKAIVMAGLRALRNQCSLPKPSGEAEEVEEIVPRLELVPVFDPIAQSPQHPPMYRPVHIVHTLPSPRTHGIYLRNQSLGDVIAENARRIGLSFDQMAKPSCPSPFYTPLPALAQVATHSVPPDLYPTPAQRRLPHHPFFDLLPFPWFRERVLALTAVQPPAFDRFELKKDILTGGLVCWKSRSRGAGQPWDRRSWEVKPWFVEKWGWLIEEQGKVEQQSKWWRALRED